MYRVAVVILHYENVQDTLECIKSLDEQIEMDFDIIVVDNGSDYGKVETIESLYSDRSDIHFLHSKENLGFARGNNLGFRYAKHELHSEIIILANNDLIFEQKDFVKKLVETYKENRFDVAGPKIISLVDGMNQNPVARMFYTKQDVQKRYIKTSVLYCLNVIGLDFLLKKIFAKPIQEFQYYPSKDFQLHGACMIFGRDYVNKYEGLYSGTFMYGEEDILRYQVEQNHLKLLYLDKLTVKHKEGSSTNTVLKKNKLKRRFFYKWSLDSMRQLMRMMS